jgi:hypothetical protein
VKAVEEVTMFRRLSVLGTLLLAACTPQGPGLSKTALSSCVTNAPSSAEAAAWRAAVKNKTAQAYRSFINNYPNSCYTPLATARLSTLVDKKPTVVRNLPKTGIRVLKPGY